MTAIAKLRTIPSGAAICLAALTANACGDGDPAGPSQFDAGPRGEAGRVVAASHVQGHVPFKGALITTSETPAPLPAGCELFLLTTQEGEFTHLGRFTGVGTTCGFNVLIVEDPPINPGGGPPPYFVANFTVGQTYTAANGDLLEISGGGVFVQSLTDGSAGLVGTGVIEGGTGRFAGATGEFDVFGVNGQVSYDGWIDYDASS